MEEESIELPEDPVTQFGPVTVHVTVCTPDLLVLTATERKYSVYPVVQ